MLEKLSSTKIIEHLKCGVVVLDEKQKMVFYNDFAKKIFRPIKQLQLDNILRKFFEGERDHFSRAVKSKTLSHRPYLLLAHKRNYEAFLTVLKQGKKRYVLISFHDVTHYKHIDQMKDEFLSIASHELRTPMTAIMGNVDMVLKGQAGPISEEVEEYLEDALIGADRLIALVNDMLDVSRIEANRMKFRLALVDLNKVIEEVIKELKFIASAKNLKLWYNKSSTFLNTINSEDRDKDNKVYKKVLDKKCVKPLVWGDQDKIIQILNNLVGNAIKFTQRGTVTVKTECLKEMVNVSVTDTGMGISKEDQKKLFRKFSQIDSTASREAKGTGLGLYISKQIIKKLGGELKFFSAGKEKGSTFSFTLPLVNSAKARILNNQMQKVVKQKR